MTLSPEYPDLTWMGARSFTPGRITGQPTKIVIHATDNTASATAEGRYAGSRTDGVSAHYFIDGVSAIQSVRTTDTAHAALFHGNQDGIQYELCGRSGGTWPAPVLVNAARQIARDMRRHGIPLVRLEGREVRDRSARGICGHVDMTNGWPEDNGTHTDPGASFPWGRLFTLIRDHLEGNDMAGLLPDERAALLELHKIVYQGERTNEPQTSNGGVPIAWLPRVVGQLQAAAGATVVLTPEDRAAIVAELAAAVLAGLPPAGQLSGTWSTGAPGA